MLLKPSDFFEKKKIQEQLQSEVVNPEEEIKQGIKRLKSPSDLFNPPQLVESIIEEETNEKVEVDPIEEIKNLVEEVRSQIPNIPEIKTYDEELVLIKNELDNIFDYIKYKPEPKYYDEDINLLEQRISSIDIKYYDEDIQALHQKIDNIEIPEAPKIKYYDEDIQELHHKIDAIKIPEIKYYDSEVFNLSEEISTLESKVRALPTVKYYDEDVKQLNQKIDSIKIPEIPEIKYYDEDVKQLHQKIDSIKIPEIKYYDEDIEELSIKINEIKIPEIKYYDEDIKQLHQKIDDIEIPTIPEIRYYEQDIKELHQKIDDIKIPNIKYYDKDIIDLKTNLNQISSSIKEPKFYDEDIKELYNLIKELKEKQETLLVSEGLLNEPPETNSEDPLTPTNQNFATLEDLSNHYKLFINRIQQQLSTLGGGGETRLEFLDDVDRATAKTNGYYLKYDGQSGKFIGSAVTSIGGSQTLEETLSFGNTSSLGMSVGVITATAFVGDGSGISGISTFSGDYADLSNKPFIPSDTGDLTNNIGFITSYAEISTLNDVLVRGNTSSMGISAGVITATSFVGDIIGNADTSTYANTSGISTTSQGLTGTPSITVNSIIASDASFSGNVSIAGTLTYEDVVNVDSLGIITARSGVLIGPSISVGATITSYGDAVFAGIVTAVSFVGSGSNLTGITTSQISGLSTVSVTGSYNDLIDKPTIPSDTSDLTNSVGFITSYTETSTLDNVLLRGNSSSIGINVGVVTSTSFDLGNSTVSDKAISTNSLLEETIDSFSISEYRSATYEIQITRGSSYHTTTLKILHDGVNVYLTEYGTIKTSTSLASFSSDISGNLVRILSTPSSNAETNFKIIKTLVKI